MRLSSLVLTSKTQAHGSPSHRAAHLRQSILLSSLDSPELRALFTRSCHNRSGKLRAIPRPPNNGEGVLGVVPRGLRQVWSRFEGGEVWEEDEKRFEFFTTKVGQLARIIS